MAVAQDALPSLARAGVAVYAVDHDHAGAVYAWQQAEQSIHMLQRDTRTSRNISSSNLQMRAGYGGTYIEGCTSLLFYKIRGKRWSII